MNKPKKKVCFNCGILFGENDVGNLGCYFHPFDITTYKNDDIEYKFRKEHYECCGLTTNIYDKKHFESQRPYGCQKIDHYTKEEFDEIKKNPYKVIVLKDLEKYKYATDENSFIFKTVEELNDKTPLVIEFSIRNYELSIDLNKIQEDIKKKMNEDLTLKIEEFKERVGMKTKSHEVITDNQKLVIFDQLLHDKNRPEEDRQNMLNILSIQNKIKRGIFIPFAIIMRISISKKGSKRMKLNAFDWCPFGY